MSDQGDDALVFGTSTGGPFDPGDVSKRAAKAWKGNCEPFTLHECRHGFASVCIEADVNAKRIQTWMGHSSINTTFDLYGRLLDRSEAESVGKVDSFLAVGPAVGPPGAEPSGKQRNGGSRPRRPTPLRVAAEVTV
jgi:integrase